MSEKKLSQHILFEEAACKCGCGQCFKVNALINMYENFRSFLAKKAGTEIFLPIHCINRCETHNKKVGGEPESKHLTGSACDLSSKNLPMKDLYSHALEVHQKGNILFGGLGLYDWGIHIDVSGYRFWDKRNIA